MNSKIHLHQFSSNEMMSGHKQFWTYSVSARSSCCRRCLSCSSNFQSTKSIPKQYSKDCHKNEPKEKKQRGGRPVNTIKEEAFAKVVNYLVENEDEQLTISDLAEFLERPEEAYSQIYIKKAGRPLWTTNRYKFIKANAQCRDLSQYSEINYPRIL